MRYAIITFYEDDIYCLYKNKHSSWGYLKSQFPKALYNKYPRYRINRDNYFFEYSEAKKILKKYKRYNKRTYIRKKFRYDNFRIIRETKIEAIMKAKIRQQLKM